MPAGTMTARRAVLRWLVMPAAAISLAAGLGPVLPGPHAAADAARMAGSLGSPVGPGRPITAYVANGGSGTVTPIATATNTAGTADHRRQRPLGIAITPDGKTAYVTNDGSGTVTPIATATNTAGAANHGRERPRRHRDHAGRQDRLRRQPRLGHGDPDHDRHQHRRHRRSRSAAAPTPSRSRRTARPPTSPTTARAR